MCCSGGRYRGLGISKTRYIERERGGGGGGGGGGYVERSIPKVIGANPTLRTMQGIAGSLKGAL